MDAIRGRTMPRAALRYELFLPINDNDGRRIQRALLEAIEDRLLERFRGLTVQQRKFPLRGIWQGETRLYVDQILLMTVFDFRRNGSMRFMARLKVQLLSELKQEEILITETPLRIC
jgi:hypothetical protein